MPRPERVDDEIRKLLNEIVARELKDPRLDTFVCVTAVSTAKDLKTAKAYVSVMDKSKEKGAIAALNNASTFIRGLLFEKVKIRLVPHIVFVADHSVENGDKIDKIIKKLHEYDKQ